MEEIRRKLQEEGRDDVEEEMARVGGFCVYTSHSCWNKVLSSAIVTFNLRCFLQYYLSQHRLIPLRADRAGA